MLIRVFLFLPFVELLGLVREKLPWPVLAELRSSRSVLKIFGQSLVHRAPADSSLRESSHFLADTRESLLEKESADHECSVSLATRQENSMLPGVKLSNFRVNGSQEGKEEQQSQRQRHCIEY